ncbi:MAG: hypothetical protein Q9162_005339 [Coniocarpon cinnabarinum]
MALKEVLVAIGFGVGVHRAIFRQGEWHLQAPWILIFHIIAFASLSYAIFLLKSEQSYIKLFLIAQITATYLSSLFTSIVAHRLLSSPLSSFSGPLPAKISKLWHLYKCLDAKNHLLLDDLHKQYGDFVRTGPNELAIFDPGVHQAIDGTGSKFRKANWYDNLWPDLSVVSCRAIAEYEDNTLKYVEQLESLIASAASTGQSINASDVFYWFGWDVMGEVVFSKSFRMLEGREWHIAVTMLHRAMKFLGPATPVPWLAHIGFKFLYRFSIVRDWFAMQHVCHQCLHERIAGDNGQTDIFRSLIAEAKKNGMTDLDQRWLRGDAVLAILAGR